jgi:hypothetical protein
MCGNAALDNNPTFNKKGYKPIIAFGGYLLPIKDKILK